MDPRWSGAPAQICGWRRGNLKKKVFNGGRCKNRMMDESRDGEYPRRRLSWSETCRLTGSSYRGSSGKGRREVPSWGTKRAKVTIPEGERQKPKNRDSCSPPSLGYVVADFLVLAKSLRIPHNQITMDVHLSSTKHTWEFNLRGFHLSHWGPHLVAVRDLEWLQVEGECRRVVAREEPSVIAEAFWETPEQTPSLS